MDGPLLKKKFRKETTGMGLIHSYFLSGNKSVFIIWKSHSATWIYPLSWHALCYDLVKFFLLSNSLWRWRQIARGQELIPQKQTWLFLYEQQLMDWRIEAHFMHYISLFASHGHAARQPVFHIVGKWFLAIIFTA